MKRLFEFRVYDIIKDDNNREFLNKVKDENPELYDRFMSLIGNKGLEIAKQKYLEFDTVEVEKREKQQKKDERRRKFKEKKENYIRRFLSTYGDAVNDINNYLITSPLKKIINIIREEKNLKKWNKKYQTLFLGRNSSAYALTSNPIDKILIVSPNHRYPLEFGGANTIKIEQYVNKLTEDDKKIGSITYSVQFNFEPHSMDLFISDRDINIGDLTSYKYVSYDELKELLEKFKYYMSDKYKEDWKIEQEVEKYNI